jgi:ATP/maltotriose-dependent transcriptional regulator MalT
VSSSRLIPHPIPAGWVLFDTGHVAAARGCLAHSLELARAGADRGLLANIHYRLGRIHLHHGDPASALTEFHLGSAAVTRNDSPLTTAILSVNQAWVNAIMGQTGESLSLLGNALDAFARTGPAQTQPRAAFFDETDLTSMTRIVHTELARRVNANHTRTAIPALTAAIAGYGEKMTRSRTFALICLAANHLIEGDVDHATRVGTQALEAARGLTSSRVIDRLRPLHDDLRGRRADSDARDLAERIARLIFR